MMDLAPDVDLKAYAVGRGIRFRDKRLSAPMRAVAWVLGLFGNRRFLTHQWTTMTPRRVFYPDALHDPRADWKPIDLDREVHGVGRLHPADLKGVLERHRPTLLHEFQHAADARRWPVLFQASYVFGPLPILGPSARVRWEARGYAWQIRLGRLSVDDVVGLIWSVYLWPLPKRWIRRIVEREVAL